MSQLNEDTLAEFKGQLIDTLEDYLEEHGVTPSMLPNEDRDDDDECAAIIYGWHYDMVGDNIELELRINHLINQSPVSNPDTIADIVNHIFEDYQELMDMIKPAFVFDDDDERWLKHEIRQTFVNWEVFV